MKESLTSLFRRHFSESTVSISEIHAHASQRRIFRLRGKRNRAVGVSNADIRENKAFIAFTEYFLSIGLPVPRIFAVDHKEGIYLIEDLGDTTFFDLINSSRKEGGQLTAEARSLLFQIIEMLPRFQVGGSEGPHLRYCYPAASFDRTSILRDMHYFEREYLGRLSLDYDAKNLHRDFQSLATFIQEAGCACFMYRDFQSRNVMIYDGKPFFLDYQSGRRGPLQYDLVSFLYQSQADFPQSLREEATEIYLDMVTSMKPFPRNEFYYYLDAFILIRLMQVLGTYGAHGLGHGKKYFIESIPYAIKNLRIKLPSLKIPLGLQELRSVCEALVSQSE